MKTKTRRKRHYEKTLHVGPRTKLTIIETKELPPGTIIIEGARPVDSPPVCKHEHYETGCYIGHHTLIWRCVDCEMLIEIKNDNLKLWRKVVRMRKLTFEVWFLQFEHIAKKAKLPKSAYKEKPRLKFVYYDSGIDPENALANIIKDMR